jgi:hypothetical protein
MPAPYIKSVTWLMWHTARMLDYQTAPLANTGSSSGSHRGGRSAFPSTYQTTRKIGVTRPKRPQRYM